LTYDTIKSLDFADILLPFGKTLIDMFLTSVMTDRKTNKYKSETSLMTNNGAVKWQ